ncbi:MFS transporter [Burkholderia glumae]|uniref:MFS transporter n=1 Tax=Burkholderia glumae TaxID=337 RepID=UPI0003A19C54|nr:MFS transporter [Burkholderia glumae]
MRATPYWSLIALIFLVRTAIFMIVPFLFMIVSGGHGGDVVLAGLVVGAIPLTSSVTGVVGGPIADIFPRKTVMIASAVLGGGVFIGFSQASGALAYMACALALGVVQGCFEPASAGLMVESIAAENRDMAFGHRYLAINVAAVVGPLIGGLIALKYPVFAFLCTAFVLLLTAVLIHLLLPRAPVVDRAVARGATHSIGPMLASLRGDRTLQICFAGCFLMMIIYGQLTTTFSSFVVSNLDNGARRVGMLMSLNAGLVVTLQILFSKIGKAIGRRNVIAVGVLFYGLAPLAPVVFGAVFTGFIVFVVMLTFGEMFLFPVSGMLFAELSSERTRSTYMGLFNATSLGLAVGPALGSIAMRSLGLSGLCVGLAAIGAVMGLSFAAVMRSERLLVSG